MVNPFKTRYVVTREGGYFRVTRYFLFQMVTVRTCISLEEAKKVIDDYKHGNYLTKVWEE